jgi:hypothetical protein
MLADVEGIAEDQHSWEASQYDSCFDLFFIFLEEVHDVSLVRRFVRT